MNVIYIYTYLCIHTNIYAYIHTYIYACLLFTVICFKFKISTICLSTFSACIFLMIHVNYDFLSLKSYLLFILEVRGLFWELLGDSAASGSLSSDPSRTEFCCSPSGLLFQCMLVLIFILSPGYNRVTLQVQLSTVARFLTVLKILWAILMFKIWVKSHIQIKRINPGTSYTHEHTLKAFLQISPLSKPLTICDNSSDLIVRMQLLFSSFTFKVGPWQRSQGQHNKESWRYSLRFQ